MVNANLAGAGAPRPVLGSMTHNVFVSISAPWRLAIIIYVLVWTTFPPLFSQVLHGTQQQYSVLHILLVFTTKLLLLLPFLLQRLAGLPIGWLHPIVFPTVVALATGLGRTPQTILYPFIVWFEPVHQEIFHPLLTGWSVQQLSLAHLKMEALTLLSIVSLYAGFIIINPSVPSVRFFPPRRMAFKVFVVLGVLALAFLWLIQSGGGIVAHISSFGLGRQRALEGEGHLVALIGFAPVALAIWYAFNRSLLSQAWYLILLFSVLAMQFMTSGSRSATLTPLILLLAVWIFHNRRIPATRAIVLGVGGLIVIGLLGQIRTSSFGGEQQADFSALTNFDPAASLKEARKEIEERSRNSAALPTIALVGDQLPLLWGRTYVSALTFFVPSTIWEGKPRGAGAHAGSMVFGRQTLKEAKEYEGAGIPPGAVAEAYWSFHVPGVVLIFLLFGMFKRWLANMVVRYQDEPAMIGVYLFSVFSVGSPSTVEMTAYFRNIFLIALFYYFLGVLRVRKRRVR